MNVVPSVACCREQLISPTFRESRRAYLDHDETGSSSISSGKVNCGLVIGDIKALDSAGAGLERTGARQPGHEEE